VIRQESFFEGFVTSEASAGGLMQLMPATGQELADRYDWPPEYTPEDLMNPAINLRLGASYLSEQYHYFGDLYVALAAYNAWPGNANIWRELAGDDPDVFLELIRFDETRTYLIQIAEFMNLYRILYGEP
jgi:soluble lytic murein transglycosylase